jgi:hypothetical protein
MSTVGVQYAYYTHLITRIELEESLVAPRPLLGILHPLPQQQVRVAAQHSILVDGIQVHTVEAVCQ